MLEIESPNPYFNVFFLKSSNVPSSSIIQLNLASRNASLK